MTHRHRQRTMLAIGAALALVMLAGAAFFALLSGEEPEQGASAALLPTGVAEQVVAPPTATLPAAESGTAPTEPAGPVDPPCQETCLVRVNAGEAAVTTLAAEGLTPSWVGEGAVWLDVVDRSLARLRETGQPLTIVAASSPTLPLYVVQFPDGPFDPALLDGVGEVVDQVGSEAIVSMPGAPPYIRGLTDMGLVVSKLPPSLGKPSRQPGGDGVLDDAALAEAVGLVSSHELKGTIESLQATGNPGGLGTRNFSEPGNVIAAEELYRRLGSYGLEVWYEDFIADDGTIGLNVVGEIAGRDSSEIYFLSAHFDTIAQDRETSAVAPGGLDNGTGVAALLETARILSRYELAHPLHIIFFNAEEIGLQGAHHYAAVAVRDGIPYAGGMNVDSVGATLTTNRLVVNADAASLWLEELVVDMNDRWGLGVDVQPRQNPKISADDTALSKRGIPTILLASVMYGDPMINRSGDTIDQVNIEYLRSVTKLVVLSMGSLLVTSDG